MILHGVARYHLALRLLYTAGLDQIQKVADGSMAKLPDVPIGPDSYKHVYQLEHCSDKLSYDTMLKRTLGACLVTELAMNSGFLNAATKQRFPPKLIGGLILRHILQMDINAVSIGQATTGVFRTIIIQKDAKMKGVLLNPSLTLLFNHSCASNAISTYITLKVTNLLSGVFYAARQISAGEEVTINYGVQLLLENRETRQAKLLEHQYFQCDCNRCMPEQRDNPRTGNNASRTFYPIGCDQCGSLVDKSTGEFRCVSSDCGARFTMREMRDKYDKIDSHLQAIDRLYKASSAAVKKLETEPDSDDFTAIVVKVNARLNGPLGSGGLLHRGTSLDLEELYNKVCSYYFGIEKREFYEKSLKMAEQNLAIVDACFGPFTINAHYQINQMIKWYQKACAWMPKNETTLYVFERSKQLKQRANALNKAFPVSEFPSN